MNRILSVLAAIALGLLICILVRSELRAQHLDPRTSGSTYVIAFPDTLQTTFDTRFPNRMADTFALFIYSAVDNEVRITSPNGYDTLVRTTAGKFTIVYLNQARNRAKALVADAIGVESLKTFRIEAERPIILYCYMATKFGTEAFTPLPVESWGHEYFAAGHPGEVAADVTPGGETTYNSKNAMAPAELLITAAFDNTFIEIFPGRNTELLNAPRLVVTLKANQCYLLETWVDTLTSNQGGRQPEMAGTRILSNKPISVISGNTRAQLNPNNQGGLARNSFENLCIEALAPVEQHGREFVYLPTWDSRRITGAPDEKVEEKRSAELVRLYGTISGRTNGTVNDSGRITNFSMFDEEVWQDHVEFPAPRVYGTDTASQAFLGCMSTVIFKGKTGPVGFIGASWDAYGSYMVELVPREQWTSFAPYYAPTHPPQMEHFVNIVADTASARRIYNELGTPVAFNRGVIPGTDLVWGSMAVAPGVDHYFVGHGGARFFAFAYGLGKGYELYRPGRAGKKDGPPEIAGSGSGDGNHLLHPSEYEEIIAQSYGYPLAPGRVDLSAGDSLVIETTPECEFMHVTVRTTNAKPLGLRTIYLDSVSTASDLTGASPDWQTELIGATQTEFDVVLRSGATSDSGSVIVQDRSGKIHRVPFNFSPDRVRFDAGTSMTLAETRATAMRDTVVLLTNLSSKPLPVGTITLGGTQSGFSIVGSTPSLPSTIPPGGSVRVTLRFTPPYANETFGDTLSATSDCGDVRLALVAESVLACLTVNDLNFGTFEFGKDGPKTLTMELCNSGRDTLRFDDPTGEIITWLSINFTLSPGTIDTLKKTRLLRGECISVDVTFQPTRTGVFTTTAKVFNATECGRDTSVWSAVVIPPLAAPGASRDGYGICAVRPTPTHGRSEVVFSLGRPGDLTIQVFNQRGEIVSEIHRDGLDAGEGSTMLDALILPVGTYLLRLSSGEWSATTTLVIVR